MTDPAAPAAPVAAPPVVPVPAKAAQTKAVQPKAGPDMCAFGLVVRGPRAGRWRTGRHFGPVETTLEPGSLTIEQAAEIEADAALNVRRL